MLDMACKPGDRKGSHPAGRTDQGMGGLAPVPGGRGRSQPGEHRRRMTEKEFENLVRQDAIAHRLALEMIKIDRSDDGLLADIGPDCRPNIRRNRFNSIRHACENSSFAGLAAYRAAEN